jgi:hypothetical protein
MEVATREEEGNAAATRVSVPQTEGGGGVAGSGQGDGRTRPELWSRVAQLPVRAARCTPCRGIYYAG